MIQAFPDKSTKPGKPKTDVYTIYDLHCYTHQSVHPRQNHKLKDYHNRKNTEKIDHHTMKSPK